MLLRTRFGLQRVHIEHLSCDVCGWYGAPANLMVPDLYFGVADKWELMRSAENIPFCPVQNAGPSIELVLGSLWKILEAQRFSKFN